MNHKTINHSIINSEDLSSNTLKDKKFYEYLLNNNVCYYYSRYLSKQKTVQEKNIIQAGDRFNQKYLRTLRLINKICEKHDIDFLLFKTFKYISEAVDGDIDLFVKKKDFPKFLTIIKEEGFRCEIESVSKAACSKNGLCKIEPRVDISFHGRVILKEESIWKNIEEDHIGKLRFKKTTRELDAFFFFLNILHGPNYLKLYQYFVFKDSDPKKIYSLADNVVIRQELKALIFNLTGKEVLGKSFPLFPTNLFFLKWWLKRNRQIKNALFFLYAKYGYKFFNHLPFRHDWGINYV